MPGIPFLRPPAPTTWGGRLARQLGPRWRQRYADSRALEATLRRERDRLRRARRFGARRARAFTAARVRAPVALPPRRVAAFRGSAGRIEHEERPGLPPPRGPIIRPADVAAAWRKKYFKRAAPARRKVDMRTVHKAFKVRDEIERKGGAKLFPPKLRATYAKHKRVLDEFQDKVGAQVGEGELGLAPVLAWVIGGAIAAAVTFVLGHGIAASGSIQREVRDTATTIGTGVTVLIWVVVAGAGYRALTDFFGVPSLKTLFRRTKLGRALGGGRGVSDAMPGRRGRPRSVYDVDDDDAGGGVPY